MMEPDIREVTNVQGFCYPHFSMMLKKGSRLSNALILESHLKEIETSVLRLDKRGVPGKKEVEAAKKLTESCFVCEQIQWAVSYTHLDVYKRQHITWDNINEMIDSGRVEIQNHSYNMHSYDGKRVGAKRMKGESDLDYEAAFTQDLTRAQERIRQMTGWTPTCFAYPFGAISDGTQTMLRCV